MTTEIDGSFSDSFNLDVTGSWSVKASWTGDSIHEGSTSSSKSFTVKKKGGCIIATTTYGSELSPEVQFLRDFRDNTVLTTFAGSNFMDVFNSFYYSWSPSVASKISDNEDLKGMMKIVLYPLIGTLHISQASYSVFTLNPELGVLTAGLVASSLIALVYFLPFVLLVYLFKKVKISSKILRIAGLIWLVSIISFFISEIIRLDLLMKFSSSTFVLATIIVTTLSSLKVALQYKEIKSSLITKIRNGKFIGIAFLAAKEVVDKENI